MTDGLRTEWSGWVIGWRTTATMLGAAAGMTAATVVLGIAAGHLTAAARVPVITAAALLAVGAVLCLGEAVAAGVVVVRVSAYVVQVRPGLLPVAGLTIPVRNIRAAHAVNTPARPWGAWGWWWLGRPAAGIAVRSGPALTIELASGREVLVSVDHPERAARLLSRRGGGRG
jgi:hypothetical protein